MNITILHQKTVLVLNRHWLPISAISPVDALCHLVADSADSLFIDGGRFELMDWVAWSELPPDDLASIGTTGGRVRLPTVIILRKFQGLPICRPSFGFRSLWKRDGGRCQYSGRRLAIHEADIDHVIPRSRGGRNSWDNCVISDRKINRRKGAKTLLEAGLNLVRKPTAPRAVPVSHTIENTYDIKKWDYFLTNRTRTSACTNEETAEA